MMRKKTFIIFGLLIAALAIAVPFWAFKSSGDPQTSERKVPEELLHAKELFQVNCGTCHRLYAAGTDGNFGPNLDRKLAPNGPPQGENAEQQIEGIASLVKMAIEQGVPPVTADQENQPPTRMPAGILGEAQAEEVADFVARVAGQG